MTLFRKYIFILSSFIALPLYAEKNLPKAKETLDVIQEKMRTIQPKYDHIRKENSLIEREVTNLSERLVIITEKINVSQEHIETLEETIKSLDEKEVFLSTDLQTKRSETAKILSAMGRLSLSPQSPLGAMKSEKEEMQAGILLKSLNRSLKEKAAKLVHDIDQLALMRDTLKDKKRILGTQRIILDEDKQKLSVLLEERRQKFEANTLELTEYKNKIQELSKKEENITDLIHEIQAQKEILDKRELERMKLDVAQDVKGIKKNKNNTSLQTASLGKNTSLTYHKGQGGILSPQAFKKEKGNFLMPAPGKVVYGFGARDLTGKIREGMTILTRSANVVTAPTQGEVLYVGQFRDYGKMVILKLSDGYHVLLAGLGNTLVSVGQNVIKGEPLGRMSRSAGRKNLYFELRKHKKPIDPTPWLKRYS